MEITATNVNLNTQRSEGVMKNLYTQKLSKDEAKELKQMVVDNANKFTFDSVSIQNELTSPEDMFQKNYEEFQSFLKDIGYDGKPIAELSKDEAAELVSEDGIFGIKQTSQRMADFVINGANGDEDLLRAGREGIIEGYNQAQELWGGELPEISQKTLDATLKIIDKEMADLGYNVIDTSA